MDSSYDEAFGMDSGAMSGAITDGESSEAKLHAYKYYDFIRSIKYMLIKSQKIQNLQKIRYY